MPTLPAILTARLRACESRALNRLPRYSAPAWDLSGGVRGGRAGSGRLPGSCLLILGPLLPTTPAGPTD
ncbi:hypothetical protein EVAR_71169_1 [Eumeta japonica]|uniref:Uncharacterized protein n=1 Tax=Eumeta variegata TaxID=151549 RepID=A0A4C1ZMV2_EUMVA|nr:hypothetical protein EVAR_71169_1 [Eumeta japonica]